MNSTKPILILTALLLGFSSSVAAVFTWNGGGNNNNWNQANNWGGTGPATPGTGVDDLIFAGSTRTSPNMQNNYNEHSVSFASGAAAFTIGGASTLTLQSGGITNNSANTQTINTLIALGTSQSWNATSGALVFGGTSLNLNSSTLTINGGFNTTIANLISGTGGITKNGSAILNVSGASSYSGATLVNAGTIRATAANSFSTNSAFTVGGGLLDLNNFNQIIGSLAGSGNVSLGSATLAAGRDNTSTIYSGAITGSGGYAKNGSGTQTFSGANTYSGDTTVNAGTLQAGAANTFSGSSAHIINSGGTLDLNSFNQTVAALSGGGNVSLGTANLTVGGNNASTTFSGSLSGSGTLSKVGSGTLTLSGNNAHSSTIVNGGGLIVSGSHGGSVVANNGTTVTGSGSIVGGLTLNAGATVSAGDSGVGVLNSGDTALNGGSTLKFDINNATGAAGTDWDLLSVANLTLNASSGNSLTIDITGPGTGFDNTANYSWRFASVSGNLFGFDSSAFAIGTNNFGQDASPGIFSVSAVGNDLYLNYAAAVPEPSILALGAIGFAATAFVLRRKK